MTNEQREHLMKLLDSVCGHTRRMRRDAKVGEFTQALLIYFYLLQDLGELLLYLRSGESDRRSDYIENLMNDIKKASREGR